MRALVETVRRRPRVETIEEVDPRKLELKPHPVRETDRSLQVPKLTHSQIRACVHSKRLPFPKWVKWASFSYIIASKCLYLLPVGTVMHTWKRFFTHKHAYHP